MLWAPSPPISILQEDLMRHVGFALVALVAIALAAGPVAAQEGMQEEDALRVTRAVLATGVEDREPVGVDSVFTTAAGTLYFYTVFEGDFGERDVEHVWLRDGEEMARVPLTVRGPRWRTWSSKAVLPDWTGSWTVKVVGGDGTEHAAVAFTITDG
jgi:hypothetical protein